MRIKELVPEHTEIHEIFGADTGDAISGKNAAVLAAQLGLHICAVSRAMRAAEQD
jgi:hypothetical protein